VLEDISLDVHRGYYLGVVGPNGSGKTTLLKIILGLLTPQAGTVKLFGADIHSFDKWSKIGYVPQKATGFDPNFPATVDEVVLMGRYRPGLWRRTSHEDRTAVRRALEQVDMWRYRQRLIGDLSGGQQQRIFIARALVNHPEVIFLDEPTTGVDQKTQDDFYALLRKLNTELDLTLILISHDIETITREASHIACIDRSLVCHTTPEEFLKESTTTKLFGHEVKFITHHHHNHH
jgi:zinc transport system ATP-binding protein